MLIIWPKVMEQSCRTAVSQDADSRTARPFIGLCTHTINTHTHTHTHTLQASTRAQSQTHSRTDRRATNPIIGLDVRTQGSSEGPARKRKGSFELVCRTRERERDSCVISSLGQLKWSQSSPRAPKYADWQRLICTLSLSPPPELCFDL